MKCRRFLARIIAVSLLLIITRSCLVAGSDWLSWSQWSTCNRTCDTGSQMRNRTCPSKTGSPPPPTSCPGVDRQYRKCNIHFCEEHCYKAYNSKKEAVCCFFPNTVFNSNAIRHYNACLPLDGCSFKCPLNREATEYGTCYNGTVVRPWSPWSACSHECFTGRKYRTRAVIQISYHKRISEIVTLNTTSIYCNTEPCNDSVVAVKALDEHSNATICYFNSSKADAMFEDCQLDGSDNKYKCYLDRFAERKGECLPIHGNYSEWSLWSACNETCFGGMRNRTRNCDSPAGRYHGRCFNHSIEYDFCSMHSCKDVSNCVRATPYGPNKDLVTDGVLIESQAECCLLGIPMANGNTYSECSYNNTVRNYTCPLDRYGRRRGLCHPINGNFSAWSPWSACTESCFTGTRIKVRNCTSPKPLYGGNCLGPGTEIEHCNEKPCIDLSECTNATYENKTYCCAFNIMLNRTGEIYSECRELNSNYWQCPLDRFEQRFGKCLPIDSKLTEWSAWGPCVKRASCQDTVVTRTRTCHDQKYGGRECNATLEETESCVMDNCRPDASWSGWTASSSCSKTCGNGTQLMTRNCIDNKTQEYRPDGDCDGSSTKRIPCSMKQHCPGYLLANPGQNCSLACKEKGLACYWSRNQATQSYRTELETRGYSCSKYEPNWSKTWHPACFVNESQCFGFESVQIPSCGNEEVLSSNIKRFCRCIYQEDLVYTEWSTWTTCSRLCGSAYRMRTRACAATNQSMCSDTLSQRSDCELPTCPDDLGYSPWSTWSKCSRECSGGLATRKRICNDKACFGHDKESRMCNTKACKVDGGWTEWTLWSPCSKSCGSGTTTKTRWCMNPAPLNGGKDCNRTEAGGNITRPCNTFHCSGYYLAPINTQCNETCLAKGLRCVPSFQTDNGTAIFEKLGLRCTESSSLSLWTQPYHPSYQRYTGDCMGYRMGPDTSPTCQNVTNIPVNVSRLCSCQNESDIGYGEWSLWGECSQTCGPGQKRRYRTCKRDCGGTNIDISPCKTSNCPVNGGWGNFTDWSPCSTTCGGGIRRRYRYCNSPEPKYGGLVCDGNDIEKEGCNFQICPIHGMWGAWSQWSLCNKPCNNGTAEQNRFCDSPKPLYGGRKCVGSGKRQRLCNGHKCRPVSIGLGVTFYNETFVDAMKNKSFQEFSDFQRKVDNNVRSLYHVKNSHVESVEVHWLRNGSVVANFTVNYTEITRFELIILMTSLQEKKMLTSMPLSAFTIKTEEIPAAPGSVICRAISESKINVLLSNFSEAVKNFVITGYSVTYRKAIDTSGAAWQSHVTTNDTKNITLVRLEPFTLYTIRATAVTIDAIGIPSDLVDVSTLEGVPSEPPSNVTCSVTSSKSIYCEWQAVPYISQNGIIRKYIVRYRIYNDPNNLIVNANSWSKIELDVTSLSTTVASLKPYTRYEVKLSAKTKMGEGPETWITLKTDEDVPSSPPLNITGASFVSNSYVDFFWSAIPLSSWNGRPLELKLSYSVTRKGSQNIIGGPVLTVKLKSDRKRYRVTGLQANWQVTMKIRGVTAAGDGSISQSVVADTCFCSESFYAAWYSSNPYIFKQYNTFTGILPSFLARMISTICGTCKSYSKSTVYFDRTKSGRDAKRTSESNLKSTISNDLHFHGPISGQKHVTIFEGSYQYVNLIDSTASVFVVVDSSRTSKTGAMARSIAQCWPILVVCIFMTLLTGILIWMADQFTNPEELPTGQFLHGVIQGFWWAFVSMTTVGYGDIAPRGYLARSIAIIWTAVGLIVNGILVSSLSTALTVVTVAEQRMLYGARVSAVFKSPEYYLGLRRNAIMNSTGVKFMTSREALGALINRQVQGTLLEYNEAANLQSTISANGLKISKKIASTSGVGFVLSDSMASFHKQIRSYVATNYNLIQSLVKNFTKEVVVPAVPKDPSNVSGLFDSKSDAFKFLLKNSLTCLAVAVFFGLLWNFVIRAYILRRNRVKPAMTENEILQECYINNSATLIEIVDDFVSRFDDIEKLSNEQGLDRFRLLLKHFETIPFGPPMWLRYGSTDNSYILAKIRIEEMFLENLNKKKKKKSAKKSDSLQLTEVQSIAYEYNSEC